MKYLLFFWVVVGLGMVSCASSNGYTIKGRVDGMSDGEVHMIIFGKKPDTLQSVALKEGVFEMRGTSQGVIPAMFRVGSQNMGGTRIFLENKMFTVKLDVTDSDKDEIKGGGEAQQQWNEYIVFERACSKAINDIREEFISLLRQPGNPRLKQLNLYMDSIRDVTVVHQKAFLEAHPMSYVTLNEIAVNIERCPLAELKERFNRFIPEMQRSYAGKIIATWIAKLEELSNGQKAPDFTVQTPDGKSFSLYSVKAKVKLIDFWASWCAPCRAMIPDLLNLYQEFHDRGFEIVSISMDTDKNSWMKAIKEEKLSWMQGSDLKGYDPADGSPLLALYGIWGVPHLVLLDEDNRILCTNLRGKELRDVVASAFKNMEMKTK